jgi:hypothetical protein
MEKDVLEEKAKEAVSEAEKKETINNIRKRFAELYPGETILPWVGEYIYLHVYCCMKVHDARNVVKKSNGGHWKYVTNKPNVMAFMQMLKEERSQEFGADIFTLQKKAIRSLEGILDNADTDSTRLKAIEMILKKFKVIDDKPDSTINLNLPTIEIVTKRQDEQEE